MADRDMLRGRGEGTGLSLDQCRIYQQAWMLRDVDVAALQMVPAGRKDLRPVDFALPWDWEQNPHADRNWMAQQQRWIVLDQLFYRHDQGVDDQALPLAVRIVLDWCGYYASNNAGPHVWEDFAAGARAMKLSWLLQRWMAREVEIAPDDLAVLARSASDHAGFLLDPGNLNFNNHAFALLQGAMCLSTVMRPPASSRLKDYAQRQMRQLVDRQFTRNGVHREHSFGYQRLAINWLQAVQESGLFPDMGLADLLQWAEEADEWMSLPDGRVAPVGDTDGSAWSPDLKVQKPAQPGMKARNLDGFAVVRGWAEGADHASYLCLQGAHYSKYHKHADTLSLLWHEGEDILSDPGKYKYADDKWRDYMRETRAHNAVQLGETSQSWYKRHACGDAIIGLAEVEDGRFSLSGRLCYPKQLAVHVRQVDYQPGAWLLIRDAVRGLSVLDQVTQWLNFAPHLEVEPDDAGYRARLSDGRILLIRQHLQGGEAVVTQHLRGQTMPALQGWMSTGYGEITPSWSLGARCRGRDMTMTCLLAICEGEDDAAEIMVGKGGAITLNMTRHGQYRRAAVPAMPPVRVLAKPMFAQLRQMIWPKTL